MSSNPMCAPECYGSKRSKGKYLSIIVLVSIVVYDYGTTGNLLRKIFTVPWNRRSEQEYEYLSTD
uniref:Transmembrane protein n=1 Tax=Heterorhabditis bacteriophora TaxID=37862 RepID=A0A1I7XG52_HETBA